MSRKLIKLHLAGELNIPSHKLDNLLLPCGSKFTNNQHLENYIKNPTKDLASVPLSHRESAFKWLVTDIDDEITELNLSGHKELCNILKTEGLESVFNLPNLSHLKSLCLDGCELQMMPKIECFPNLVDYSLKNNKIKDIPENFKHNRLYSLHIQGNPIPKIHFNSSQLPALQRVTCGSPFTREISSSVLKQMTTNENLHITVPEIFRTSLKSPTHKILVGGSKSLRVYVNGEFDFSLDCIGKTTFESVNSMINRQEIKVKSLRLSGQSELFTGQNTVANLVVSQKVQNLQEIHFDSCNIGVVPYLQHLLQLTHLDLSDNKLSNWWLYKTLNLPGLTILQLKKCGLDRLPSLSYLPALKHLDFSDNITASCISVFQEVFDWRHPLETLDLSGNPIKEIHINRKSFPKIKRLTCGSQETLYISYALLQEASANCIVITVPDSYKNYLKIPWSKMLDDPQVSLDKFLKEKRLALTWIRDVKKKYETFQWIFRMGDIHTSLVLSGQEAFCQDKTVVYLPNFLQHSSLSNIVSLYLDKCGLTSIPVNQKYLPNLKYLDVSKNNLIEVCTKSFDRHERLETLLLDGNLIEIIKVPKVKKHFPQLKYIQAGSKQTKHISMPLLEEAANGELTIKIVKEHEKSLVFPPFEVLMRGQYSLDLYIKEISASEKSKTDVWKSTTLNILMFLGSPEAGKTSLKRTLKENKPKPTLLCDRTVILERDVIDLGGNISIATLDFGGHDIYELEYPLFLRGQNIIALIVIDILKYDEDTHDDLVTKWLHNCVLSADCKVIFVLTKIEESSSVELHRKTLLMETLVKNWLKEEIRFLQKVQKDFVERSKHLPHYQQMSRRDYEEIERSLNFFLNFRLKIIPTSSLQMKGLDELKQKIRTLVKNNPVRLSETWDKVLQYVSAMKSKVKYHILFKDIEAHVERELKKEGLWDKIKKTVGQGKKTSTDFKLSESIEECLRYLSKKGIILWYDQNKDYIYNNVDNILELHKQLFRHDLEDSMKFDVNQLRFIESEVKFDLQKGQFLATGLLTRKLLQYLWVKFPLSDDELEGNIKLIKANDHCFEDEEEESPIASYGSLLRFPWFISTLELPEDFWQEIWTDKIPYGHLELKYVYKFFRRLPSTLYERISVRLQKLVNYQHGHHRRDWIDGVFIRIGKVKLLIRRHVGKGQNPQLTISLRAPANNLSNLWTLCLRSYNRVVNKLVEQATVVTYDKAYICPHCILVGRSVEDASKLPLSDVMESNCRDDEYYLLCSKPDTEGQMMTTVPAAFLQPATLVGTRQKSPEVYDKHMQRVMEHCKVSTADHHTYELASQLYDEEKVYSVGAHLGITFEKIKVHRTDNARSITMTAYEMLTTYLQGKRQETDLKEKHIELNLKEAFVKAGFGSTDVANLIEKLFTI